MNVIYLALAPWSPFFLPVIFPAIGYTVASILKQARWSAKWKDLCAWIVLLFSAFADVIASGVWSQNPNILLPALSGVFTLLVAGAYGQLTPWLVGMTWVEKTFFNLPMTLTQVQLTEKGPIVSQIAKPPLPIQDTILPAPAVKPMVVPAPIPIQNQETGVAQLDFPSMAIDQQTTGPAPIIRPTLTMPTKPQTTTTSTVTYPEHL